MCVWRVAVPRNLRLEQRIRDPKSTPSKTWRYGSVSDLCSFEGFERVTYTENAPDKFRQQTPVRMGDYTLRTINRTALGRDLSSRKADILPHTFCLK